MKEKKGLVEETFVDDISEALDTSDIRAMKESKFVWADDEELRTRNESLLEYNRLIMTKIFWMCRMVWLEKKTQ